MKPLGKQATHLLCAGMWGLSMPTEAIIVSPLDFELWARRAANDNWDALAAVLLCLLPNLENFYMVEYGSSDVYPFVEAFLDRAAKLQIGELLSPDKLYQFPEQFSHYSTAMSRVCIFSSTQSSYTGRIRQYFSTPGVLKCHNEILEYSN